MEYSASTPNKDKAKEVILITGGSGLIGKAVIEKLTDKYQCIGLDKIGNPFPRKEVENINFDITSPQSIRAALERVGYAYGRDIASVIHLAAYYDFSGEPSPLYEKVTVRGTENLIQALQDYNVNQFIFSSTNLVYKPTSPGQKIDEDWPLEPSWDYPKSKVDTEKILHQQRGSIPVVILRLAGVYDDEGDSIPISHQIQRIYERSLTSRLYSGDLLHGNAFVHLDDLTDALVKTVETGSPRSVPAGNRARSDRKSLPEDVAINISEPKTFSYDELQQEIGQLVHGEEWDTFEIPKPIAKAGAWVQDLISDSFIKPWMIDRADDHYELDITRAKELLHWQPQHSLKDTLPKIIKKLKENPKAWYKKHDLKMPDEVENS